jgi:hypothetical protein
MVAQLNHIIVWSSDQTISARFLAEMLGRPAPARFGPFDVVELDNGVSLDFADAEGPIRPQHYAFLISEADFDGVLRRIRERGLEHWPTQCATALARSTTTTVGEVSTSPTPMAITSKLSPDPTGAVPTEPAASGQYWAKFKAPSASI